MSIDEKTERALRVLLDKQEIHEVLMRYCRGIDRCDAELLHSVYHPDATDDHGLFKGKAADFIPWALKALVRDEGTSHYIANELIEVDGDVAHCESYFFGIHRRQEKDGTTADLVFAGRYADRFERRAGRVEDRSSPGGLRSKPDRQNRKRIFKRRDRVRKALARRPGLQALKESGRNVIRT